MTSDKPADQRKPCGCPEPDAPSDDCDPTQVARLACEAEGIAARAEYDKSYTTDLQKAHTDYEAAQKAYREKRHIQGLLVQDLRHQVKRLKGQIICMIRQDRVRTCLEQAWGQIKCELSECGTKPCCTDMECEFSTDTTCLDDDAVLARIAEYEQHVARGKKCFLELLEEPVAMEKRIGDVKKEVADITAGLGAEPSTINPKELYAKAIVAEYHLEAAWAWKGFEDTKAFVDCLCRALTCWTKGCAAVSVLKGDAKVRRCGKDAEEKRCERLRTATVDEILALYEKICAPHDCEDTPKKHHCCDGAKQPG